MDIFEKIGIITCPFCHKTHKIKKHNQYTKINILCDCGAKWYAIDYTWSERKMNNNTDNNTIEYTDELYEALKTIHYALKNDREGLMPILGMEAMHYKVACESLEEALKEQGVELPG